jgi:hypothetical protein
MGIFTVPVQTRNTRIYVSASERVPNIQLTLFKNEVHCESDEGFLILPVPYPHTIRFHDPPPHPMNSVPYLEFLNHVETAFDFREHRGSYRPNPLPPLHRIGKYELVRVAESIDHLRELNHSEGILPSRTLEDMVEIYPESYWGFIILRVLEGDFVYEPFCYSHQTIHNELFVPALTHQPRSYRDHHILEETNRFDDRYFINGTEFHERYGHDHNIMEVNSSRINMIPWRTLPSAFQSPLRYFICETRRGLHANHDLFYRVNPSILYENHQSNRRRFDSDDLVPPPWW